MILFNMNWIIPVQPTPPPPVTGIDGCHLVPILTSKSSPSPITCSVPAGTSSSYPAYQIFDGTANYTIPTAAASGTLYTVYLGTSVSVDKVFCISHFREDRVITHLKLYVGNSADYTQCTIVLDTDVTPDAQYSSLVDVTDNTATGTYLHFICDSTNHRPQTMELIPIGKIASVEDTSLVRLNAIMTGFTAPWGIASANYNVSQTTNSAYYAFGGSDTHRWITNLKDQWLMYEFPMDMRVKQVDVLTSAQDTPAADEFTYTVELLDTSGNVLATKSVVTQNTSSETLVFDSTGVLARKVRFTRTSGSTTTGNRVQVKFKPYGYSVKHN